MKTQSDSLLTEPWLSWAIEIQSIAQNGLTYCKNIYDIERYERLRDLSAEMLKLIKQQYPKKLSNRFSAMGLVIKPLKSIRAQLFSKMIKFY
ncbi:MAG: NUDIX hydrolase N-terminal domain-containing protein [Haemophilus parainfluenzae]